MASKFARELLGRTVITSNVKEISASNVIDVVEKAYNTHQSNCAEIDYLFNYYKGDQPVLCREKKIRADINNKIVENRANEIVSFKTGYLVGEPIQYVSSSTDENISKQVVLLNNMMALQSKSAQDEELVDWQHICGTAYRMAVQNDNANEPDEAPFEIMTIDPRECFVVYSSRLGKKPLCGVYISRNEENNKVYSVYTPTRFYEIIENKVTKDEVYPFGRIPIIEYPANAVRQGAFETVISLLDAINELDSNRLDAVAQFVQALCVAINCNFPKKEDGSDITANDIQEAGMLVLKSFSDLKPEFKILSEQLDQSQNQTLKNDLYQAVLTIVGMPSQSNGTTSDSSNNGAVILRHGWQSAEARAKKSEIIYKKSETEMLKVVLRICKDLSNDISINASDIKIKFTRRNYEDIVSKEQVLIAMLGSDKIDPHDAYAVSGLFPDPEEACKRGLDWYDKLQKLAKELAAQAKASQNNDSNPKSGNEDTTNKETVSTEN